MADQIFSLALDRPTRDSYGFALRPQHAQRYKEYAKIYEEEEEERSDRWSNFLDHVVESTCCCSSEKEIRKTDLGTPIGDDGSISESEVEGKAEQISKGTKSEKWAQIRSCLGALEHMLSSRAEKQKKSQIKDDPEIEFTSVSEEVIRNEVLLSVDALEPDKLTNGERSANDGKASAKGLETENHVEDDSSIEPFFSWKEELESLVRGGVPKDLRGEVWQALAGVKARRVERYYNDLLARDETKEKEDELCSAESKWKRQIEKDIPRTFPGHPALDENGRNSLRRVLLAYARHNPSVGYCQAMNFFAGLLLLLMPEENAFWTLVGVLDYYFDSCYTEEMIESQVDQLVFEELMRERFPKLVNHLDYLGVQVAWISGPWFLSIFVNILPWESVLRVWDVLLYDGNRVMLFRTALALMELYGHALVTTKDAGDATTLLQNLTGSTFDSSQLVLTACMGFRFVTESRLEELRAKHRPAILELIEERSKRGRIWKDSSSLATKLYSFKCEKETVFEGVTRENDLDGLAVNPEVDSLPDLQEQVMWLKVELCKLLEEKRSAVLRAEELETALVEIVKHDNRRQLTARVEELEQELANVYQALSDKKEQEAAMLKVLIRVEQEQQVTEDARLNAEQEVAVQKHAVHVLQEKYEKAMASFSEMEKRVVMAESMLEATLQYQSGQVKAHSSPRASRNQENSKRAGLLPFGLGWRDRNNKANKPPDEENYSQIFST